MGRAYYPNNIHRNGYVRVNVIQKFFKLEKSLEQAKKKRRRRRKR